MATRFWQRELMREEADRLVTAGWSVRYVSRARLVDRWQATRGTQQLTATSYDKLIAMIHEHNQEDK